MQRSVRALLAGFAVIMIAAGFVLREQTGGHWMAWVLWGCALLSNVAAIMGGNDPRVGRRLTESDDISEVSETRRMELIRGTSLHLRNMKYRYSVRADHSETTDRRCFTAEVNGVRLGFVPVIVTDNTNDRQGFGYVAFVYDEDRWRGPGLPCPDGQPNAVRHAAKCVSPLAKEEETKY
ncbi:MAG TPA: hypothetical protein VG711_02165 [Phycisphaerales bacterium]|nr:hypothetical protein [Phycisphaerales bacterium]